MKPEYLVFDTFWMLSPILFDKVSNIIVTLA